MLIILSLLVEADDTAEALVLVLVEASAAEAQDDNDMACRRVFARVGMRRRRRGLVLVYSPLCKGRRSSVSIVVGDV
jgi:hypothetical protein